MSAAEQWVYVEEPRRGAPEGFCGVSKYIETCWVRYTTEDALNTDAYARRIIARTGDDLWAEIPRNRAFPLDYGYSKCRQSSADTPQLVVVFDRQIMSAQVAVHVTAGTALVYDYIWNVKRAFDMAGRALEKYGKTVWIADDLLIRPLLEGWTEVTHDPRRAKNYLAKNQRDEELRRKKEEEFREAEKLRYQRDKIGRMVITATSYADGICQQLLVQEARRRLPAGFSPVVSVNLRKQLHSLVRSMFQMRPEELLKKKAVAIASRAYIRKLADGQSNVMLRNAQMLVEALKSFKELKASRREVSEIVGDRADERYFYALLPVLQHLHKNRHKFGMVDEPKEKEQ